MATYAFGRLPIGTLAYRINLFSAVCGALACACIFLTGRRLGVTRLLSAASALTAAASYPVWSNSVTAEVYTLAAVLSGFAVYWLIAFAQTGAVWRLYAACAMWACGFGNHLTIVGILPCGRCLRCRQGSIRAAAARRAHRRRHRHSRRAAVRLHRAQNDPGRSVPRGRGGRRSRACSTSSSRAMSRGRGSTRRRVRLPRSKCRCC
jgi:hypothetical protein